MRIDDCVASTIELAKKYGKEETVAGLQRLFLEAKDVYEDVNGYENIRALCIGCMYAIESKRRKVAKIGPARRSAMGKVEDVISKEIQTRFSAVTIHTSCAPEFRKFAKIVADDEEVAKQIAGDMMFPIDKLRCMTAEDIISEMRDGTIVKLRSNNKSQAKMMQSIIDEMTRKKEVEKEIEEMTEAFIRSIDVQLRAIEPKYALSCVDHIVKKANELKTKLGG